MNKEGKGRKGEREGGSKKGEWWAGQVGLLSGHSGDEKASTETSRDGARGGAS